VAGADLRPGRELIIKLKTAGPSAGRQPPSFIAVHPDARPHRAGRARCGPTRSSKMVIG
jgi:hypothetical protein